MRSAIIMAGGQSLRMRESLGREHKALVKVLGVPMLERNLVALLSHGFRDLFLAVNAKEESVLAFAKARATQLARACNAELKLIVEKQPLGTIGAAAKVRTTSDDLVVVNVDNLTTLDLEAFLKHHQSAKAAMTIATHTEPFKIPFGQVWIKRGRITRYQEKPVLPVLLSSGTYVLNKGALSRIPSGRAVGAPEVVNMLLGERYKISAFQHSSPWIDVNDSGSVRRAEELIMANFKGFELWRESPERHVAIVCALHDGAVAVLRKDSGLQAPTGRLPAVELFKGERPEEATVRCSHAGLTDTKSSRVLVSFDEIDTGTGERTRYHVVLAEPTLYSQAAEGNGALRWAQINDLSMMLSDSHGDCRTLSYLNRYAANSHSVGH
jgi:mannose-1-phosphate guanylyltransferase/phosphomannomutase